ncbi:MAG: hypothetical protein NTY87_02790 [Planctomycetia bacterium]|nr:hypothetical protein [Planctomycetia bacterium]
MSRSIRYNGSKKGHSWLGSIAGYAARPTNPPSGFVAKTLEPSPEPLSRHAWPEPQTSHWENFDGHEEKMDGNLCGVETPSLSA